MFRKVLKKNKCTPELNHSLVEEVTNLVETPVILKGKFNPEYLVLPDELLNLTMVNHQRYFPMKSIFDDKLINSFLFVANNFDNKNLITKGNEKVIDARLSDAKFFWDKNRKQNPQNDLCGLLRIYVGGQFHKVAGIRKYFDES